MSTMLEADKNVYRAVSLVSYSSIFPLDLQKRYAASRTNLLCPKREKSASCSLSSTPDHGIELAISAVLIPNSQCKSFTPTRTNSTTYLYHNCSHGVKLTTSNLCSSLPLLSTRTLLATYNRVPKVCSPYAHEPPHQHIDQNFARNIFVSRFLVLLLPTVNQNSLFLVYEPFFRLQSR
jgi:hypothetical protein